MPELPEVENVKRQLEYHVDFDAVVCNLEISKLKLRFPQDSAKLKLNLLRQKLIKISRQGKYMFLQFSKGDVLISHLGMTGHWRVEQGDRVEHKKHDHFVLTTDKQVLIYNDPRRFGFVIWKKSLAEAVADVGLGPDALEWCIDEEFLKRMKAKATPIKSTLLDQSIVAGIGNIYACEILFSARIKPQRKTSLIKKDEWVTLVQETKRILHDSISHGGSTIDNYLHPDGQEGSYQQTFNVYGRAKSEKKSLKNQKCLVCRTEIRLATISGRSTFWCPQCQK